MVRLKFETDMSTSIKASNDLAQAVDKIEDSLKRSKAEANALERAAKRIVEQNETPLERYNRQIEKLANLQKAGALSAEQSARAASKYAAELESVRVGFVSLESLEQSAVKISKERTTELLKTERAMAANKSQFVSLEAVEKSAIAVMREHNQELAKSKTLQEQERSALERTASQIRQGNMTAVERYEQKLTELNSLVAKGVLTQADATRAAARYGTELTGVGKAQEGAFGAKAMAAVSGYLAGVVSISTAVQLFRSEMEAIKAEAEKVSQSQLTAAGARDVLKRNIAPGGAVAGRKIEARADALAAELGLPQAKIDVALAEAFSSSENEDQAFSRARVAAQFLKTRPEGIGAFTGALGDISKSTKSNDDLRNLGFLINVSGKSRVADDQKFADTFPAAAAGMAEFGASAEESGALFNALGKAAADNEGRITGTGGIQLARQLEDKKVKGGSFGERLQSLWNDPRLARKFIDDASFESKVVGPMRGFLLDKNSPMAREYREMKGGFGNAADQVSKANETISYLDEGRIAGTAAVERTIGARTDQFRLGQDAELTIQSRADIISRTAKLRGMANTQAGFATFMETGSTMSPQEAIDQLVTGLIIKSQAGPSVLERDKELIENTKAMVEELKAIRNRDDKSQAPKPSGRQE